MFVITILAILLLSKKWNNTIRSSLQKKRLMKKYKLLQQANTHTSINKYDKVNYVRYDDNSLGVSYYSNKYPNYFKDGVRLGNREFEYSTCYYEYTADRSSNHVLYTDFANERLGGGWCYPKGLVQEEIMVIEIALFASILYHLKCKYKGNKPWFDSDPKCCKTRIKTKYSYYVPTPIIITGLQRSIELSIYGSQELMNVENIHDAYTISDNKEKINILAIAAPDIKKFNINDFASIAESNKNKLALNILYDIFNTIVAGYESAIDSYNRFPEAHVPINEMNMNSVPIITINSGKLGCGVFGNDPILVGCLHYLAQEYINNKYNDEYIIKIKLWGYSDEEYNSVQEYLANLNDYGTIVNHINNLYDFYKISNILD